MEDTNRIPESKKYELSGLVNYGDIDYVDTPNTGGVPNGVKDITHPSVYYNPNGWKGFTHWFAISPYPQQDPLTGEAFENPCVFHANGVGGVKHPTQLTPIDNNPIYPRPVGGGYNSDPEIFMHDDKLWVINRRRGMDGFRTTFLLQSSDDGLNWSEAVVIYQSDLLTNDLCPMYIFEDGKHRIYIYQAYNNPDDAKDNTRTNKITIIESDSLDTPNFTDAGYSAVEGLPNIWHGGIFAYKGSKYLIGCGVHDGKIVNVVNGNKVRDNSMFLAKQIEGTNDFKFYNKPLTRAIRPYRAHAFIDENNSIVCYFSFHNLAALKELAPSEVPNFPTGNFIAKFEYNMDKLIDDLEKFSLNSI